MAVALLAGGVRADWLAWTVDFNEDYGGMPEGSTLQENPAGKGAEGYSVWLVAVDEGGNRVEFAHTAEEIAQGTYLVQNDAIGIVQVKLDDSMKSGYSFFIEMGFEDATSRSTKFMSGDTWSYNELVDIGCITETEMEVWYAPLNGGVGVNAWNVPEPTGGVLALLGAATLLLRRRRRIVESSC